MGDQPRFLRLVVDGGAGAPHGCWVAAAAELACYSQNLQLLWYRQMMLHIDGTYFASGGYSFDVAQAELLAMWLGIYLTKIIAEEGQQQMRGLPLELWNDRQDSVALLQYELIRGDLQPLPLILPRVMPEAHGRRLAPLLSSVAISAHELCRDHLMIERRELCVRWRDRETSATRRVDRIIREARRRGGTVNWEFLWREDVLG